MLDFLTSRIGPGDIDIHLDLDHAVLKLLVPAGTRIDDDDLRRIGRGRVKDWTGERTTDGRRINLRGELRDAEIRVHRGGIAILSLLLSGRSLRWSGTPTVTDVSNKATSAMRDPVHRSRARTSRGPQVSPWVAGSNVPSQKLDGIRAAPGGAALCPRILT